MYYKYGSFFGLFFYSTVSVKCEMNWTLRIVVNIFIDVMSNKINDKPLSNDWFFMRRRCEAVVAARGGHTRYWTPQTSILHDNFCLSMICSGNDVEKFCWYCLICYAHMNLNYTFFLYVKNIEHQTLVSFLLLTSIYHRVE
jgi:hypothetical protein